MLIASPKKLPSSRMILAEKIDGRRDLVKRLEEWLKELVREAYDGEIRLEEGFDGWITLTPDEEIIRSTIELQVRMSPIASGKPPYLARVLKLTESKILVEYPSPEEKTIVKSFSTRSFAATLGYSHDRPKDFLNLIGIFEGAPVSLAAGSPSRTQLKLLFEQVLRGLDRIMLLRVTTREVEEVLASRRLRDLIAYHEPLTLLTHMLYVRLGADLEKAYERAREELEKISRSIVVKPLPWKELDEALRLEKSFQDRFEGELWWAGWESNPRPPPSPPKIV